MSDDPYMDFLDKYVGVDAPPAPGYEDPLAPQDGFTVQDDESADWALEKLGWIQQHKARHAAIAAAKIARAKQFQAEEDAKLEGFETWLISLLARYYEQLQAKGIVNDRHKSYRLPAGALSSRFVPVEFERDDEALLPLARAWGLVRVTEVPDWAQIKRRLLVDDGEVRIEITDERTGEVRRLPLPGVRIKAPAHEHFSAKPMME